MTRERALELIALLPDPPAGTRLCWTPWEYSDIEEIVYRFGYAVDDHFCGQGLAQRVEIRDGFEALPVSDLIGVALAKMMQAEAAVDRLIPVYAAEEILKR